MLSRPIFPSRKSGTQHVTSLKGRKLKSRHLTKLRLSRPGRLFGGSGMRWYLLKDWEERRKRGDGGATDLVLFEMVRDGEGEGCCCDWAVWLLLLLPSPAVKGERSVRVRETREVVAACCFPA
ncbi:hypothetical protein HAX54_023586 [Datura stramonium]|uniref:Uncharacterized protein n=1 Tax=Datura stramonium TaxID=4076 RepID=A0ABS8UWH3_DATST|nr:hypothetical protein [Datura stramonium]